MILSCSAGTPIRIDLFQMTMGRPCVAQSSLIANKTTDRPIETCPGMTRVFQSYSYTMLVPG